MKFSQFAGTAVVPTLSRLVLAFAFITAGYNKLFTVAEFDGADAAVLQQLGVKIEPVGVATASRLGGWEVIPALFVPQGGPEASPQETEDPGSGDAVAADPADEPAGDAVDDAAADGAAEATDGPGRIVVPGDVSAGGAGDGAGGGEMATDPVPPALGGSYTARAWHKITLLCHRANWPSPQYLAMLAGLTEFVGGVLLLVGFLSRVWSLGLTITMGVAIYLVSVRLTGVHKMSPAQLDVAQFNALFAQLGLFVLAFGVLLTGPGPLSLDRILFRRRTGRGAAEIERPVEDDETSVPSARPI